MHPACSDQGRSGSSGSLPVSRATPSRARAFVRAVIAERALSTSSTGPATDRLSDDAALLVSELTSNAFMHAGTETEVRCQTEVAHSPPGPPRATPPPEAARLSGVLVEVVDRQPAARVPGDGRRGGWGLGLEIVNALAESWGVTYRHAEKVVWFHVDVTEEPPGPAGPPDEAAAAVVEGAARWAAELGEPPGGARAGRTARPSSGQVTSGGTFLAEASELLAGQLDEDMIAALAGQLLVPRLADWCAVWLTTERGGMRLSRVWHADERRVAALRTALEPDPPVPSLGTVGVSWPWPEGAGTSGGSALAFSLVSHGDCLGHLVIGRSESPGVTDAMARTVEDVARRVAQAVVTARIYTRQASINRALQRRQLPQSLATLPGVESAIVYEPHGSGQTVGGDFYDLFPVDDGRWCFLLGDVQGKDPEAMSVTGLSRHLVRLLAREGHGVGSVLGWVNAVMAEDAAESASVGGEVVQPRFLSLVYGELVPEEDAGGAHCTLASAGHPLPLRLAVDGTVTPVVRPQMLLGIDEHTTFTSQDFCLAPGETLLCVTDGVTERRSGERLLDDDDGLSAILRGCVGMGAMAVAERVRRATHDFGPDPVEDDIAVLVLHAVP
ncbi:SpoIIE family protein phosphatase [Streptomyces sp. 6N223]|uniref:SpoIIE family protein phosphatase n=1 Tax=Streptomyces sp. 6N223 TaxID=3457412 RepID=UPI003FD54A89